MAIGKEVGTKLSAKSFGWDKETILEAVMKDKGADVPLYRILGVASGLRKYKSDMEESGEGYGLSGQFKGYGIDGTEKTGAVVYLPKSIHTMVEAALTVGDDVQGVRIGFDIYARYDKTSATSYVYVGRDILDEGSSSLDSVIEAVSGLPALGAPDGAVKLEDKRSK
jgi:hypothetical protein